MFGFVIKHYKVTHLRNRSEKAFFNLLISLLEDEDVIDYAFYNIFLSADLGDELIFEGLF